MSWLSNHCDGMGPHGSTNGVKEVRLMPLGGGGNLILCMRCWENENKYRAERGRETGAPENFPQVNYFQSEIYATEENK